MAIGSTFASESASQPDPKTGRMVRQVTDHPSTHHHPFFYIPAYDDPGARLFFVSHRTGEPQLYFEDGVDGRLVQLSARPNLNEWSCHPSHDGRYVYYTAGSEAWRVDVAATKEERICSFGDVPMRSAGFVGASMGTTSLSHDDRWWCVYVKAADCFRLHILDAQTGADKVILERDFIAHPQFHPDDSSQLRYAGPHTNRLWIIRRDGSDNRLVYERNADNREWIVHETWRPGTREIVAANWPHGVIAVDVDSGGFRWLTRKRAWHPMVSRDGAKVVADTNWPDEGLIQFSTDNDNLPVQKLCYPAASNVGDHWHTDHCPYDDGLTNVYAPQHTHPHPSFSPDGRRVVFTSDRSGFAQIYELESTAD